MRLLPGPLRRPLSVLCGLSLALAGCGGGSGGSGVSAPERLLTGPTQFVSADVGGVPQMSNGQFLTANMAPVPAAASTDKGARTAEEGDIYRVLENGKTLLNLNRYRGLQIIDISNPAQPAMLGRAPLAGDPVEMYRVGDKAYVLLNGWSEYRRLRKGAQEVLDRYHGGAIVTLDIANRSAPAVLAVTKVNGSIQASRLTSGGGKAALYVAAIDYSRTTGAGQASAHSFSIDAQGIPQTRSQLDLGGYVSVIQSNGERLTIAHTDSSGLQTRVAVVDTSSPDGVLGKSGEVAISGIVSKKTNMHVEGNVLRVASSNSWGAASNTNHLETFDISDIANPKAIDHASFGDGQQLYATTFLADKAFFVTYLRKDPFHAFSISAQGLVKEQSQFVVSGWNDFFMPAYGNSRLVGVGHNDENNARKLAVSLYDITQLSNPAPLVARAEIDLTSGWSEANWDDRAFTVLDNAVSVRAADGKTSETGLVLLPFSGYDESWQTYHSGVQIFTFSPTSLTLRGVMRQDSQVRRSFLGDSGAPTAVNLSDSDLSLFNLNNTDAPAAQGSLALAPSYTQYLAFSNVGVRYLASDNSWWGNNGAAQKNDVLELVPPASADGTAVLSRLTVPSGSHIYNVAGKLVVVSTKNVDAGTMTTIASYDVGDPAKVALLGSMTTDQLVQPRVFYLMDLRPCGIIGPCGGSIAPTARVLGNALVFDSITSQSAEVKSSPGGMRYWSGYTLQVVDMSNPAKPALLPKISTASDEEAVALVASGTTLWVNTKKAQSADAAGRAQAKFYARALDLRNAAAPSMGKEINIPGQLAAVTGDTLVTFDYSWNGDTIATTLDVSILQGDLAYLQASQALARLSINSVLADGSNVMLGVYDTSNYQAQLAIYSIGERALSLASRTDLPFAPQLKLARNGRVLLQSDDGFVLFDVRQPQAPVAQAYFAAASWYGDVVVQDAQCVLPAGPFGLYQFNLESSNLTPP